MLGAGGCILFFNAYLIQCVASVVPFLSWHIEHHVALTLDGHSCQKMGHVHLGFIRGVPLFFLKSNQEYKLVKWGNTWVTCFFVTHVISIRWKKYAKSSHSKFWFVVCCANNGYKPQPTRGWNTLKSMMANFPYIVSYLCDYMFGCPTII